MVRAGGTRVRAARRGRWRCVDADCDAKTWTEHSDHVDAQAVLTRRAGAEACRQVGRQNRSVACVARDLGVGWSTVMAAVADHGRPLVDDSYLVQLHAGPLHRVRRDARGGPAGGTAGRRRR